MELAKRKLVVIITQDNMVHDIIQDLKSLGIKGYTSMAASGEGLSQTVHSSWEGTNIRIETIVRPETSFEIMKLLSDKYFSLYSVIAFTQDVEVYRKEKFMS